MTELRRRQVALGEASLHVVEAGDPAAPAVLFLHGWPQSWRTWKPIMELAAGSVHAIAIDLPGVGQSSGDATDGSKRAIAELVHVLIGELGLQEVTLVGQDVGAVVTFHYLRGFTDVARAVMIDAVVPGVDPWDEVVSNPWVFHIPLHSIPGLPETLIQGKQAEYFGFFFDVLCKDPAAITAESRAEYAAAYASDAQLTASFNWYRAFGADAELLKERRNVTTPVLYLRGEKGAGDLEQYTAGFRAAGLTDLRAEVVPGGGHFVQEEAPAEVWQRIRDFMSC